METYQVKYGSEVLNEFDNWEDATIEAESTIDVRTYVYCPQTDTRWDFEDWQDENPNWNEHLER